MDLSCQFNTLYQNKQFDQYSPCHLVKNNLSIVSVIGLFEL